MEWTFDDDDDDGADGGNGDGDRGILVLCREYDDKNRMLKRNNPIHVWPMADIHCFRCALICFPCGFYVCLVAFGRIKSSAFELFICVFCLRICSLSIRSP